MERKSIVSKIIVIMMTVSFIALSSLSIFFYQKAKESDNQAKLQLEAIEEFKNSTYGKVQKLDTEIKSVVDEIKDLDQKREKLKKSLSELNKEKIAILNSTLVSYNEAQKK